LEREMGLKALFPVVFAALGAAQDDLRDVVKLKAGGEVRGRVVFEDSEKVVLRAGTRERTIAMADVTAVDSVVRSMEQYLEKLRALSEDDVQGHLDLAAFCQERKLPEEAEVQALHVLRLDPQNEKAHQILKHRRGQNAWYVTVDGGEVAWGLVDKATEDWGKALRVKTEHFIVRTNAGGAAAVDLARDLELFYSAFYQVIGQDLGMREVLEPMTIHAYKSRKDWPSAGSHSGGYFDPSGRIVHVYYEKLPGRPYGLFHEATHALLFTAWTREQSGSVPGWVDEGLAEYFDRSLAGPPGRATLRFGVADRGRFQTLAQARKSAGITRIVNYTSSDFHSSSAQALKYCEVYTLVHFLLHADGEAWRPKFASYLKEAFKSKASASRLERALGKSLSDVEKRWRSYVADMAK
jgi:hypothetical protein